MTMLDDASSRKSLLQIPSKNNLSFSTEPDNLDLDDLEI